MARRFKMRRKGLRMQTMCENFSKIFLLRRKEHENFKQILLTFYGNLTKKEKSHFPQKYKMCRTHYIILTQ